MEKIISFILEKGFELDIMYEYFNFKIKTIKEVNLY